MKNCAGFGIIGNFAGHLEQAGEASEFEQVKDDGLPKGIFPFYIPDHDTFLGRYCINNCNIVLPSTQNLIVQAEPEIALECDIKYNSNKEIIELTPQFFMAFNDTSIRNDQLAKKLSQKKNFSHASKGLGPKIKIDKFEEGGICDDYSLTSFLIADNKAHQYGEVSKLTEYSLFYTRLIKWIIEKLNTQKDEMALENLKDVLKKAKYPEKLIIAIGATKYTNLGENRFLKQGDEVCVVTYNHKVFTNEEIKEMMEKGIYTADGISIVRQKVSFE